MHVDAIMDRLELLEQRNAGRDKQHRDILAIREGDYDTVAPGLFPDDFEKPLVANMIDTAARDIAEVMSPLPSVNCAALSLTNETARKFADKRTKIARGYIDRSRLQVQMYHGADRFNTLGFMAMIVEPDFEYMTPVIRIGSCPTAYYTNDYWGRTKCYAEVSYIPADELCALYPEHSQAIKNYTMFQSRNELKVVRWIDAESDCTILADLRLPLFEYEHRLKCCPVRVVERPKITKTARGQFDDVIWVQIARAMVALYTMDALEQNVHAPWRVPTDVQQITIGPNEVMRTDGEVGRIPLNIPAGLFPQQQMLTQEQMSGSRYPEGRSGAIDASIITGQGVEALMGTFNTQIKTFQELMVVGLTDVIGFCFEMDEAWWGETERTVRGRDHGSPYEVKYVPSKDIKHDYTVDVSYGAVGGMDPNRALVFILQAFAAKLLSKETAMRVLPNVDINVAEETKTIDLEAMREGLVGMFAVMPQLALQGMSMGQDPAEYVAKIVDAMEKRSKGVALEEVAKAIFLPKEGEAAAPAQDPLAALMGGGPAGAAPAPSPAGDLLMSLTGMTQGGDPRLQSTVSRQQPI